MLYEWTLQVSCEESRNGQEMHEISVKLFILFARQKIPRQAYRHFFLDSRDLLATSKLVLRRTEKNASWLVSTERGFLNSFICIDLQVEI